MLKEKSRVQGPGSRIKGSVYAVILVGGKGSRLKPLSTSKKPKAFLSVTKDYKTMFKRTIDRMSRFVQSSNIIVVANKMHAKLVKSDFPKIADENMLLEPVSRNTAPAIAYAASSLLDRGIDPVMVIVPTDQYIIDESGYFDTIRIGVEFAAENDALVVLGVKPRFPSTQFGYVRIDQPENRIQKVFRVSRFTEKPDAKVAWRYFNDRQYLWNTGAFVFKASSIMNAMRRYAPKVFRATYDPARIGHGYKASPDISIDYAVLEKAENIYCVRGEYSWQDMGSFKSLADILKRESRDFVMRGEKVIKIL